MIAADHWADFDGFSVSRNVDPTRLPLDRFCSYVWWWVTSRMHEKKDLDKFEQRLYRPPPGEVATAGPWTPEAETQAFAALKAAVGQ